MLSVYSSHEGPWGRRAGKEWSEHHRGAPGLVLGEKGVEGQRTGQFAEGFWDISLEGLK